jgi:hypothetical protein
LSDGRELALDGERWHDGSMARSKGTPERSKLVRSRVAAFARKREPAADAKPGDGDADASTADAPAQGTADASSTKELPAIEPPPPKGEPRPDATPPPMKPVEAPDPALVVSRTSTATMTAAIGRPPEMPQASATAPLAIGAVEDPTHMPDPKDSPGGRPEDPAPPPGRVPPGDSRSLRRGNEFALVYRVGTCVISRTGVVGTRGQWRVVEYPTSAAAGASYAKECSRFVSEGFSDYRD